MSDQMSAAEAKLVVTEQDRRKALKAIGGERTKLDRRRDSLKKAQEAFDRMIARAITARPERADWYAYPGPLPPEQVREAAGLSSMQVYRLMERERKRLGARPKRKGRR